MNLLAAVLLMRCPRCRKGAVFSGLLRTHKRCPQCDLLFEREAGYFTGAMYVSYGLGIFLTLPVWFTLLYVRAPLGVVLASSVAAVVLLMPVSFHYSRIVWLHLHYRFEPSAFEDSDRPSL